MRPPIRRFRSAGRSYAVGSGSVRIAGRTVPEGTLVTIDGTGGEVALGTPRTATAPAGDHLHRLLDWADAVSGDRSSRSDAERLEAARARIREL